MQTAPLQKNARKEMIMVQVVLCAQKGRRENGGCLLTPRTTGTIQPSRDYRNRTMTRVTEVLPSSAKEFLSEICPITFGKGIHDLPARRTSSYLVGVLRQMRHTTKSIEVAKDAGAHDLSESRLGRMSLISVRRLPVGGRRQHCKIVLGNKITCERL